jgi:hypothetical protein
MFLFQLFRKLFTFVFTFNVVGLCLAASGHFPYAVRRTGAMALGNLSFAILMRNELFGRFLYLVVTTCFAKVTTQTFQRLSSVLIIYQWPPLWWRLGCTSVLQVSVFGSGGTNNLTSALVAPRRHPQRLCAFWSSMAYL